MTGDPALPGELREEIVSSFERRLRALGSPILDNLDARTQMLDQARSILDEVLDSDHEAAGQVNLDAISLSVEIGTSRAIEGVHPTESLRAAAVLFETAFPFVLRAFSATGRSDAASNATLVLHRVIMSRIVVSAVSYVGSCSRRSTTPIAPSGRGYPETCTTVLPTPWAWPSRTLSCMRCTPGTM